MKKFDLGQLRYFNLGHVLRRMGGIFTEGWYAKGDRMATDRARLLACNYTSNVIANMIGGTFWTGFLLLLNADDAFVGTITMITTAANMLQFIAPLFLEQFKKRKVMLTILRGIIYLLNVVLIGLIPLFPVGSQFKLTMVAISVLLVNVINALIAPGLSIWHVQSLPQNVRQHFFSVVTMTVGAVVVVFNLIGSKVCDILAARGMEYIGFSVLRIFAVILCVIELILYFKIKEYPYESSSERFTIKDLFTVPFKEKKYLFTVAVVFLWCFAANLPGSYYTVYLLRDVEVSYSYLTVISMFNIPIVLLLTPFWRKLLTRYGWFKTLYLSMAVYLTHYILLALVTKGTLFIYPISQILAYVFAIGINLAFTGIPYVNMPEKNQTVFIGFYSSVSNLAALLGVTLGKYFVLFTEEMHLNILGFAFGNKQALVLLTAILLVGATIGIAIIDKKTAKEA